MNLLRKLTGSRASRMVWGVVVLLAAAALALSFVFAGKSLRSQEDAAQARAEELTKTVLFETLTPEMVSKPILQEDYRNLLIAVQGKVLSDDRFVRVRIWSSGGVLVFSSDQRDLIGKALATSSENFRAAAQGRVVDAITESTVAAKAGLAGSNDRLFETFVPLHLADQLGVLGVVQIDQRYSAIENAAHRVWLPIQAGTGAALVVGLALLLASIRATPAAPAERRSRSGDTRLRKTEEELHRAEARIREAERSAKEMEAKLVGGQERLRAATATNAKLEQEANQAAERVLELEAEVRRIGEGRGVPGAASGEELTRLTQQLRERGDERDRMMGEVQRLKAALTEREGELAIARAGAQPDSASEAAIAEQGRQAEERIAQLEARAREAEQRALAAEQRTVHATEELKQSEAALAALEAATKKGGEAAGKKVEAELKAAQLEVERVSQRLRETEASLADTTAKAAAALAAAGQVEDERKSVADELAHVGGLLAERDAELARMRDELTDKESELEARGSELEKASASTQEAALVKQRLTEAEARATQAEAGATDAEARATDAERRVQELEGVRVQLAEELALVKVQRAEAPVAAGADQVGRLEELERQLRELEDQRRQDVAELHRAQEMLANAQFELTQAKRQAEEAEERLQGIPAAEVPSEEAELVPPEDSIAARLSRLRSRKPEPEAKQRAALEAEGAEAEEAAPEISEEGLSLRERLARAAAARHRVSGSGGGESDR